MIKTKVIYRKNKIINILDLFLKKKKPKPGTRFILLSVDPRDAYYTNINLIGKEFIYKKGYNFMYNDKTYQFYLGGEDTKFILKD